MEIINNTDTYHTSIQTSFPLDPYINFDSSISKFDESRMIMDITERIDIYKYIEYPNPKTVREYDDLIMLRIVLLAYTLFGFASLREMEKLCRYDIRFMFVSNFAQPSHETIMRFMNRMRRDNGFSGNIHDMFVDIMKVIEEDTDVAKQILSIDGTKFEAYANKFTFIWKKNTERYCHRTWIKVKKLLKRINGLFRREDIKVEYEIRDEASIPYLMEISKRLLAYMEQKQIKLVSGRGHRKSEWQKVYELVRAYAAKLIEYTVQFDMLDGRNSCSKTDIDATMMHMKYDYYCNTNVFKPGYNVQMGLSSGFVTELYISADANDQPTYIPFMERYHDDYGFYPKLTVADSGYGSYDNYTFNKSNGIHQYLKFAGIEAEKKRVTDKNRYRTYKMKQPDGSYVCPEGHKFEKVSERVEKRGIYDRLIETLENRHCGQCPNKAKCTKAKGNRKISVTPGLEAFKNDVRENLSTPVGKQLLNIRRTFSEGVFGILKEDYEYERLHRRGSYGVELEITLVVIGFNMRRYCRVMREKWEKEQKAAKPA